MDGGDALEAREPLQAALHLARLARLGAESLHETLDVGRLAPPLRHQGAGAFGMGGVLGFEGAVVARVGMQPSALDVQDAADDRIEELAIVRHEQQCPAVLPQPFLQPQHRIEVQVIGRLIEQQQLGAVHECTRQVGAHAQAPRELAQRAPGISAVKAQACGKLRRAAARGVTTERFVARMQARLERAFATLMGTRQLRFHGAQLDVTVEDVFQERAVRVGQFLGHPGDG